MTDILTSSSSAIIRVRVNWEFFASVMRENFLVSLAEMCLVLLPTEYRSRSQYLLRKQMIGRKLESMLTASQER